MEEKNEESKFDKLFTALSKFQGELEAAIKTKQGYGYKYADIAAIVDSAQGPLEKNGLCVIQPTRVRQDGTVILDTILGHTSGQSIRGSLPVEPAGKRGSQDMGSALTYARRYAYMGILGLPVKDDDGAAADGKPAPLEEYFIVNADKVNEYLKSIKYIKEGQTWQNLSAANNKKVASKFDDFKAKVEAHATS